MRPIVALLPLLAACGGPPSAKNLHGLWVNLQMGELQGFEFAAAIDDEPVLSGLSDVFISYSYQGGEAPRPTRMGQFRTDRVTLPDGTGDGPALIQDIVWSTNAAEEGATFVTEFTDHDSSTFTLASPTGPGGTRVFTWVAELP